MSVSLHKAKKEEFKTFKLNFTKILKSTLTNLVTKMPESSEPNSAWNIEYWVSKWFEYVLNNLGRNIECFMKVGILNVPAKTQIVSNKI